MSERAPEYKVFIDWFGHGALNAGIANWYTLDGFFAPERVELATTPSMVGGESLRVVGASPTSNAGNVQRSFTVLPGVPVVYTLWVYVPANIETSSLSYSSIDPDGVFYDEANIVNFAKNNYDQWVSIDILYDPDVPGNWTLNLYGIAMTSYYVGWFQGRTEYDDVSCDIAATRTIPDIVSGRDNARDLETIRPGEITIELKNKDRKYTRNNPDSVIAQNMRTNRQVLVTADFEDTTYILYSGYTQDYTTDASLNSSAVYIPCQDILGRLATVSVATDVYPSIRTGAAIQAVVAAANVYPQLNSNTVTDNEDPILLDFWVDPGASVLRWWGYAGNALSIIQDLTESEGPPALYTIGHSNQIVFHDRLHRQRPSYAYEPTITLSGCEAPGAFKIHDSSSLNDGWRDIYNRVDYSYERREIAAEPETVWTNSSDVAWGGQIAEAGATYTYTGVVQNGFFEAQVPIEGTLQTVTSTNDELDVSSQILPEDYDYIKLRGTVSDIDLARTDGTLIDLTLTDGTTGLNSETVITDMSVKARPVVSESLELFLQDDASIAEFGSTKSYSLNAGPVTRPDADDIAAVIIRRRASVRPTFTAVIKNLTPAYTAMILSLKLGMAVRVNVEEMFLDNVFTIESIQHEVRQLGEEHIVTLELEQITPGTASPYNEFTFDDPDRGFDEGVFGNSYLNSSTVFIIGTSELDGPDVLTY